jgi:hypothetical protein
VKRAELHGSPPKLLNGFAFSVAGWFPRRFPAGRWLRSVFLARDFEKILALSSSECQNFHKIRRFNSLAQGKEMGRARVILVAGIAATVSDEFRKIFKFNDLKNFYYPKTYLLKSNRVLLNRFAVERPIGLENAGAGGCPATLCIHVAQRRMWL